MMTDPMPCRSWLPASALQTGAVEALLGDILRGWSRDWLARGSLTLSGRLLQSDRASAIGDEIRWFVRGRSLALSVPASAQLMLVRAMLDAAEGDALTTDDDRRVADDLSRVALDDLRSRLGSFGREDDGRWTELPSGEPAELLDRWEVAISLGAGVPLLKLALSNDAVIAAIKGALPPPEASRQVSPRRAGLLAQPVEVSARIGHARVSLADLAELGAGDVIVLDAGLDDPATLAIDARPRPDFACSVERRDQGFALQLLTSLRG